MQLAVRNHNAGPIPAASNARSWLVTGAGDVQTMLSKNLHLVGLATHVVHQASLGKNIVAGTFERPKCSQLGQRLPGDGAHGIGWINAGNRISDRISVWNTK